MADLVSYQGAKAVNDRRDLRSLRRRHRRQPSWDSGRPAGPAPPAAGVTLWAILFLSRGVPMVVVKDELGRIPERQQQPVGADLDRDAQQPRRHPDERGRRGGVEAAYNNLGTYDTDAHANGQFRVRDLRRQPPAPPSCAWKSHYGDPDPGQRGRVLPVHQCSRAASPKEGDRAVAVHINSPGDDFDDGQHGRRGRRLRRGRRAGGLGVASADRHRRVGRSPRNHWPEGEGWSRRRDRLRGPSSPGISRRGWAPTRTTLAPIPRPSPERGGVEDARRRRVQPDEGPGARPGRRHRPGDGGRGLGETI